MEGVRGYLERHEGPSSSVPTLTRLDGSTVRFADAAQGEPSLFVFWASWCRYCREDLAHADQLATQVSKVSPPVRSFYVNVEESAELVRSFAKASVGLQSSQFLLDPNGDVMRDQELHGLPSFVLVGADGKARFRKTGAQPFLVSDIAQELASERKP